MNGHRRTGKPVFPKTRQIKKSPRSTLLRPTARRGMCEGGTICGCPHRVKSGLGLPLCMRVYAPQGPPKKPANTHPAPPQGRGQCDGGTVCGCPHRVKSEVKPAAYAKVCAPRSPPIKKSHSALFLLVEARRVELLSENQSARLSTSVAVPLTFPLSAAGQQAADFSSSRYNHGPGALPVIVHHSSTPSCGRGPPQSDGCLIKQRTRNQC